MKKEDVVVVSGGTSFNPHTCKVINDGSDGKRIVIAFDNVRRMRNVLRFICTGGSRAVSLDDIHTHFQVAYSVEYSRSDVKHFCERLVKLGYVVRKGTPHSPEYRTTKNGWERFREAKKVIK